MLKKTKCGAVIFRFKYIKYKVTNLIFVFGSSF